MREVLRFTKGGQAAYPLFQFDVENNSVFSGLVQVIAMKPANWSNVRLLQWLTRPRQDFGAAPANVVGAVGPTVVVAFAREIEAAGQG